MKLTHLCTTLKSQSPDTLLKGLPLLFWALRRPECVALLLQSGADPDIRCNIKEDLCVSPLYTLEYNLRTFKDQVIKEVVAELLELYGASAIRYSDFCVVDIHSRQKDDCTSFIREIIP
jgi:hypothetical protein